MKLGSPPRRAVVADEGRPPAHLALGRIEARDDVLAFREVLERPEIRLALLAIRERGENREAEHRERDDCSDRRSEAGAWRPRGSDACRWEAAGAAAGATAAAVSETARASGSISGTSPRTSRVTSRAQSSANATASTAPMAAMIQLRTRPMRRHATPIAKPIGQRLGPGRCGVSWRDSLKSWPFGGIQSLERRACQRRRLSQRGDSALQEDACCSESGPGVRPHGRPHSPIPYLVQRRVTTSRISSDITISSGQGRASSSGSLCVASMPSFPP